MSDQFEIENSVQREKREKREKKENKLRTALRKIWQDTRQPGQTDEEIMKNLNDLIKKINNDKIDIDGYTLFSISGHRGMIKAKQKIGWKKDGTRIYDQDNTVLLFDLDAPINPDDFAQKLLEKLEESDQNPENIIIEERPNISFFRRKLGYEPKDKEKTKYKTKSIGGKHKRKSRKSRKSRRRR